MCAFAAANVSIYSRPNERTARALTFRRYEMTTAALGLIGVSEEETLALFRALAGVLFLGQVRRLCSLGPTRLDWMTRNSPLRCVRVCLV